MVKLQDLLDPDRVLLDVLPGSKEKLLTSMVDTLASSSPLENPREIQKEILERERMGPTGLAEGCAIPHAHPAGLTTTTITAARLQKGLDFGAQDGKPARLVFLLLGPPDTPQVHLKILSKLARILSREEFRKALLEARDGRDFCRILLEGDT